MGSDIRNLLLSLLMIGGGVAVFVLLLVFVAVPVFRGVGSVIGASFRGVGWFFSHIFEFIGGILGDVVRFIGSLLAMIVLIPLVPLNIIIGRWSAAGHFAEGVKRECKVGSGCVYRVVLRRPLRLLLLDGLLEGLEQRVPEAMQGAPGSDKPGRRTGQFDGYTILGSLRAGGSGAKLYVAEPEVDKRRKFRGMPDRVVIKSFALTEGSSLPQIVRESRALECAKQLGHVLDHGMDEHRFYYVMPYHPGDHLGILTRQFHGECGGHGLDQRHLNLVMSYAHDLLATLGAYHRGGLWHKDVKPENIIVHDGQAHLVDLGLVTPLRSAMTLTTHGTEYFRDPEMVRQALRGVKVHQVDGAKFDIYAVGAVLYFMIENTFPAHGGLSRFANNSPEALRWIIRRAMTEYNQRYETAEAMLADLDYIARSGDAFAVKPMDLPSMRNASFVEASACTPQVHVVNATGMDDAAAMDALKSGKAKAWAGFAGVAFGNVKVGGSAPSPTPDAAQSSPYAGSVGAASRPKLNLINWWTGEYRVEQAAAGAAPMPGAGNEDFSHARDFRKQAYAFRQQAQDIGRQARAGAISARKAAREQIKAARLRAREIRGRALAHRHRVTPHARTSTSAMVIGALSLLFLTGIIVLSFLAVSMSSRLERRLVANPVGLQNGRPVLLVVDGADPGDPRVRARVAKSIAKQQADGYDVLVDEPIDQAQLRQSISLWQKNANGSADQALEEAMAAHNAYGILYVKVKGTKNNPAQNVTQTIIHSTRPGADARRRSALNTAEIPPAPALPYLLINDHPAKTDPRVEARVQEYLKVYEDRGWKFVSSVDVEAAVRTHLPTGPIDPKTLLAPALYGVLAHERFGGVMHIDARAGDGPPQERIVLTRIDGDPTATPMAPGSSTSTGDESAVFADDMAHAPAAAAASSGGH